MLNLFVLKKKETNLHSSFPVVLKYYTIFYFFYRCCSLVGSSSLRAMIYTFFYKRFTCYVQVISVMSMWTRMQPAYAANMWNEALNKRLGTEVYIDIALLYIHNYICILSFFFTFMWNNHQENQVDITFSMEFRLYLYLRCVSGAISYFASLMPR